LDEALEAMAEFEYGKESAQLAFVERTVLAAAGDPEKRLAVEKRLLAALGGEATRDAREFLCRQLRTVATARSVPKLEALLTDPQLSHMARYALGRLDDPTASAALRRALGRTEGKLQAGVLSTIGERRDREALPAVAKLLGSRDARVARAAAAALGKIGGRAAVKALEAARQGAASERRVALDDALMVCAERFIARGRKQAAVRIYETFHAPGNAKHLRLAALKGLLAARGAGATPLLIEAIRGADSELRASAIGLARTVEGSGATKALADLVHSLAPDAQELLLRALGGRGDPAATDAVVLAARSEHDGVRTAAYEALGSMGDARVVELLVRAATTREGREKQVARASLLRLRKGDVDRALVGSLAEGDPATRVERVRAVAGRRSGGAFRSLLPLARDDEPAVRAEAIGALGALAGAPELAALVELAAQPREPGDRPAIEQSILAVFRRVPDADKKAAPLLAALRGASRDAKPALLRFLGRTGSDGALRAVRSSLEEEDPAVRDAAVAALADWPDATPARDLLRLARQLSDAKQKAVVLRGYLRMAELSENPTAKYLEALELVDRPGERQLVLDGLGAAASPEALDVVERYLKVGEAEVRAAAGRAAVRIADRLRTSDSVRARRTLKDVIAAVDDAGVRRAAREVINQMEQFEGYILAWLVSGPHKEKGKESRAIFDAVLPPEKPGVQDVAWKPLRRGIGSWDIDLEVMMGSFDHCAAYAKTRVLSPETQDARLELGSDDAIKVWLNGKLVHANYTHRGRSPRQDLVNVKLRKGWNDLLLKVVDHEGGWGFGCRVRAADGSALDGLKVEAK
ncbi:MAG: HEAT repeat domain-containing protein, partial [Planctomycetota bacterium]|nr:HEAT repeat domain-containing protein [Planctomycetota bacterium]